MLIKGFKKLVGNTVFRHLTALRMGKSKKLLLDGSYNISQVSDIGLQNPTTFYVALKRKFGAPKRNEELALKIYATFKR